MGVYFVYKNGWSYNMGKLYAKKEKKSGGDVFYMRRAMAWYDRSVVLPHREIYQGSGYMLGGGVICQRTLQDDEVV